MPENGNNNGRSFSFRQTGKPGVSGAHKPLVPTAIQPQTGFNGVTRPTAGPINQPVAAPIGVSDATRALALVSVGVQRCIQAKTNQITASPVGGKPRVVQRSAEAIPAPPPAIQLTSGWTAHVSVDNATGESVTNYRANALIFGDACIIEVKGSALRHEFNTPGKVLGALTANIRAFSDAWDRISGGGNDGIRLGGKPVQSVLFRYNGVRLSIYHAQLSASDNLFSKGAWEGKTSWRRS